MARGVAANRSWRWSPSTQRLELVQEPSDETAPTSKRHLPQPVRNQFVLILAVVSGLVVPAVFWGADHFAFDFTATCLILPALMLLTLPVARRYARLDQDPSMVRLLMCAFFLKEIGAFIRYYVAFSLYGGVADAALYHHWGSVFAPLYRRLYWNAPTGKVVGTNFISIVTGWVYAITGSTQLGGFLVFSWFGFLGLCMFYRAFRVALPDGDRRRYALLVFFLPSLLFWPSSTGKETWMLFALGMTALGAAKVLNHSWRGFLVLALGLSACAAVRPHMTLLVLAGLTFAYLLGPRAKRNAASWLTKTLGVVLLAVAISVVVGRSATFFNEQSFSPTTVLNNTVTQTSLGKSSFKPPSGRNPVTFPYAVVTVFFRPFLFEAHNGQGVLAALEGTALLIIFLRSWRRVGAALRASYRKPYVAFCGVYTFLFVVAFSSVGNFGIVSRERVQLYPFAVVLICLPATSARERKKAKEKKGGPEVVRRLVPARSEPTRAAG
jgi:hypothetical protein